MVLKPLYKHSLNDGSTIGIKLPMDSFKKSTHLELYILRWSMNYYLTIVYTYSTLVCSMETLRQKVILSRILLIWVL